MKKLFLATMLFSIAYISNAQTLGYNDIGVLFSKETINGTARYNAMSGAFGALGGDLSAIETNPAGAAVFINSEFATSLNFNNTKTDVNFYGNNEFSENDITNLSQAGGVFVFNSYSKNSDWKKVAIGFNYSTVNDFETQWFAKGTSGYAPLTDIFDPDVVYFNSEGQYFENFSNGENNKYTFTFASELKNKLYLGASFSTYDINNSQKNLLEEYNNDGSGNLLDASLLQELHTYGEGFSFNFGVIAKATDNLRLGLAYQSPVWYNLSEDYLSYDLITYMNDNIDESYYSGFNAFDYQLKTPSKLTGSFAYVFNKQGLISVDYIYKNYSNIKLESENNFDFIEENKIFNQSLEATGELRMGTEWRFDRFSVRGGYHFEPSPYKNALDSENKEGFSLGAGYAFKGGKIDISYQKDNSYYSPYFGYSNYSNVTDNLIGDPNYNASTIDEIENFNLNIDTSKLTITLVLNI
ncbi:outer membrane protein transport protein [Lutibacter sp. A80]|uniref:OmpP1/FadL family transporter n=1 Tax=Lutibacter sp. A80 TaxID=2918453 RepID=UPI001F060D75|nr:outer membrane protein transport protein [Lutibacter sp. A80]UMB62081.1 outer membrane protein transport protein [Lutibacter sp. A80]